MKKLVHRYLDTRYQITQGRVVFFNTTRWITSEVLVKELGEVFDLNKKALKWYIKSWAKKQSKSFNFNRWWSAGSFIWDGIGIPIPIIRRMAAQPISQDLISIQPMNGPTGQLHYLDYRMGVDPANMNREGVIYSPYIPLTQNEIENTFVPDENLVSRYSRRVVNPSYYGELTHGTTVGVSSRAPREELVRRWEESGILYGLRGGSDDIYSS